MTRRRVRFEPQSCSKRIRRGYSRQPVFSCLAQDAMTSTTAPQPRAGAPTDASLSTTSPASHQQLCIHYQVVSHMLEPSTPDTRIAPTLSDSSPRVLPPPSMCTASGSPIDALPGLPDELFVHILKFVASAPLLARLREVSTSWMSVIDSSPSLWANASFKNTFFARPIMTRRSSTSSRFQHSRSLPNSLQPGSTFAEPADLARCSSTALSEFSESEHSHVPLHGIQPEANCRCYSRSSKALPVDHKILQSVLFSKLSRYVLAANLNTQSLLVDGTCHDADSKPAVENLSDVQLCATDVPILRNTTGSGCLVRFSRKRPFHRGTVTEDASPKVVQESHPHDESNSRLPCRTKPKCGETVESGSFDINRPDVKRLCKKAGPASCLQLGGRPGFRVLCLASSAGNEWASFLLDVYFYGLTLNALTVSPPMATAMVAGAVSSIRPPNLLHPSSQSSQPCFEEHPTGIRNRIAPHAPGWLAVHAARRRDRCGGLVGIVYVTRQNGTDDSWTVLRAVSLQRPILCGGYVGLWPVSQHLTDLLIRALHRQ